MNAAESLKKVVSTDESSSGENEFASPKRWSDETVGFCSALCSAFFYSISLFSLRALTNYPEVDPDWSIAVKELTTVVCVLPFIFVQMLRGRWKFPGVKSFLTLLGAAFMCEVVGARPHMIAYSAIGIALATPLIQALQLIGTSAIGAFWLKEKVTKTKAGAIVLLIAAVWLLSASQRGESGEIAGKSMQIGLGLFCAVCTGIGYSSQMSLMRKVLRFRDESGAATNVDRTPTSLAMVSVTGLGFVACLLFFLQKNDVSDFWTPPPACWAFVLTAGVANMIGFFFQIEGLRRLYASKSTLVAASQTLALAILGIVFFNEPLNAAVVAGLILVAAGVALAGFSK